MTYIELQRETERLQQSANRHKRVGVISDMPLQPWFELYLKREWAMAGEAASIRRIPWELRMTAEKQEDLYIIWPSREVREEIQPQDIAGIWISQERLSDPIQAFYGAAWTVQEEKQKQCPEGSDLIDLERIMMKLGLDACMAKEEARWGDRYSRQLQKETAAEVVRLYHTQFGRRKKCVALDCDGVLWGGIVSEDGLSGIHLSERGKGKPYQDFQKLLKQLSQHGILLAICSKNDEADVRQVFQQHSAMILREEDIAAWSVSWNPKSQQIAELADSLRLDPQDMVLVDDQQWELDEVQNRHPKTGTVCFQPETIARELSKQIWLTSEDQNDQNRLRLMTYQDNIKRDQLRQEAGSYEAFLQKLDTKVEIKPAEDADLPRISDLSRRANQCTNGVRCSEEELNNLLQQGYRLQAVFMSDIYRDLGLVGCIGCKEDEACLDLFCLSCRALGRRVEHQLIAALPPEITKVRWQDTGKNAWLKELMQQEKRGLVQWI